MPPITYYWNSPAHDLIIVLFERPWNWDDFHYHMRQVHSMVASQPHQVDLLLWHRVPQEVGRPLVHYNRITREQPSNTGRLVAIILPPTSYSILFLLALVKTVRRLYPLRSVVQIVTTLPAAEQLLGKKVLLQPSESAVVPT